MVETRKETALDGKMTPRQKIWDERFPMIQRGPWFDDADGGDVICGFRLSDAFKSEYHHEIKMIFPGDKSKESAPPKKTCV